MPSNHCLHLLFSLCISVLLVSASSISCSPVWCCSLVCGWLYSYSPAFYLFFIWSKFSLQFLLPSPSPDLSCSFPQTTFCLLFSRSIANPRISLPYLFSSCQPMSTVEILELLLSYSCQLPVQSYPVKKNL